MTEKSVGFSVCTYIAVPLYVSTFNITSHTETGLLPVKGENQKRLKSAVKVNHKA